MNFSFNQSPSKYLGKPRIKDYYEKIYKILKNNNIKSVLDIGAASGDFLYYMPNTINGLGVDKSKTLINYAQKTRSKKNIQFKKCNIENIAKFKKIVKKFGHPTAITIFGTLTTVKNYKKFLKTCFALKPKIVIIND